MAPSLRDVAHNCQVSINTASNILNRGQGEKYHPDTCAKVWEAARRLNYQPNRVARSMRGQRTGIVGYLGSTYSDGLVQSQVAFPFLIGLSHALVKENIHLSFIESGELQNARSEAVPSLIREKFLDGLIVHQFDRLCQDPDQLRQLEIPQVFFDAGLDRPHNCLLRPERELTGELVARLRGLGHRRIALVLGEHAWQRHQASVPQHYSVGERIEGYAAARRAAGEEPQFLVGYAPDVLRPQFQAARPTAVIGSGQDLYPILGPILAEAGLRVPTDVSLASCDVEARIVQHGLAVGGMLFDRYAAGQTAARMLLEILAQDGLPQPSITLKSEFVPHGSIAECRA